MSKKDNDDTASTYSDQTTDPQEFLQQQQEEGSEILATGGDETNGHSEFDSQITWQISSIFKRLSSFSSGLTGHNVDDAFGEFEVIRLITLM